MRDRDPRRQPASKPGTPDHEVEHAVTVTVADRRDRRAEAGLRLRIGVGNGLHDVACARAHDVNGTDARTAGGAHRDFPHAVARDVAEACQG